MPYLDVYENAEYVGSVGVRDRLRGFDLLGSTLVVLVERQGGEVDADEIPDRALAVLGGKFDDLLGGCGNQSEQARRPNPAGGSQS